MIDDVWQRLAQASAAVAAAPVWQLTDADLVTALRCEQTADAQRAAARLGLIRELDARGHATAHGTTTQAWLAGELLVDRRAAAADVRAARQLDPLGDTPPPPGTTTPRLPAGQVRLAATGRALLAGQVSRAHADAVATTIRALPRQPTGTGPAEQDDVHARAETLLLAECARLSPEQVRRCGAHIRHLVDPDGALADERDAVAGATFWITPDPDTTTGTHRFGGTTDPVTAAQLVTFIDAHAAPRPALDPDTGTLRPDPRAPRTRRGHAFTDLIRLATHADPTVSGGTSTHLVVTTTLATLRSQLSERGVAPATTETGHPLSAATTRLLACDTTIIPIVLGAASEPLDIARATRTIPTSIRRALTARDRHCAFPGCDRPPRWADAHHITHWADGGPTSLENLVLLCRHDHDRIHHTDWTITIHNGHPHFHPPDNTTDDHHHSPHDH